MEKLHQTVVIDTQVDEARQQIIDSVPIEKYLLDNGLIHFSEGKVDVKILCPVHDDNNPSCFYNTEKNVYHCFSCGSKGSVVELDYNIHLKTNERESAVKAILRLAKKYNVEIVDMFNREKLKKARRNNVTKLSRENLRRNPQREEQTYARKLELLEAQVRNLPPEVRTVVYHNCDRVILGKVTAKEMYTKIEGYLSSVAT